MGKNRTVKERRRYIKENGFNGNDINVDDNLIPVTACLRDTKVYLIKTYR